jgi:hypothetical protein
MNTNSIDTALITGTSSDMEIAGFGSQRGIRFRDHDHLQQVLSTGGLAVDFFKNGSTPLDLEIALQPTEFANIVKVAGAPVRVSLGRAEIANDGGDFLGVELQRTGRSVFESGSEQTVLRDARFLEGAG